MAVAKASGLQGVALGGLALGGFFQTLSNCIFVLPFWVIVCCARVYTRLTTSLHRPPPRAAYTAPRRNPAGSRLSPTTQAPWGSAEN